MRDYGRAIYLLRKRANITQAELGNKLNVTYQAVSKWENNSSQPDFDTIQNIAKFFKISIDYFTKLANGEIAGFEEEQIVQQPANGLNGNMIGVCTKCGRTIYNDNLGTNAPSLVCKDCVEKAKVNNVERAKYVKTMSTILRGKEKHKLNISFIVATAIALPLIIIMAVCSCLDGFNAESFIGSIVLGLFLFTFIAQLFWDGAVADLLTGSMGKTFNMPGVIFTLDIDGILWAIAVKLGLFLLSIFVMIIIFFGGLLLSIFISPFTFFFAWKRRRSEVDTIVYETKTPVYENSGLFRTISGYVEPDCDYRQKNSLLENDPDYIKYAKGNAL